MDSFEINKIVAAVLLVALLIIGIGKLSNVIFHVEKPKTPGYAVKVEQVVSTNAETSSGETGEKIALETIRHHRLIELYLYEALGYSWDAVDAEAERLEHAISEEFEERIDRMLGYPTIGTHGEPIPDKNGQVEEQTYARLSDVDLGHCAVVKRVSDRDPAMLRYMDDMGLQLGTVVKVCEKAPFKGPLTLLIEADQPQTLGLEVAHHIFVDLVR